MQDTHSIKRMCSPMIPVFINQKKLYSVQAEVGEGNGNGRCVSCLHQHIIKFIYVRIKRT